jgi:hypothetical protein
MVMMNEDPKTWLENLAQFLLKGRSEASIDINKVLDHANISEEKLSEIIYHYSDPEVQDQKYVFGKDHHVADDPSHYYMLIKSSANKAG